MQRTPPAPKATPIPSLDALTGARFLAAVAVFNCHYLMLNEWMPRPPWWLTHGQNTWGESALSFFFMLSGFVLANAYPQGCPTHRDRISFWIARFARLYPLYLLCFLWFAPFGLVHWFATMTPRHALAHAAWAGANTLLLVQDWFSAALGMAWNGPGWTLSVDALFYLAFPWLAAWIFKMSRRRLLGTIAASWMAGVVLSAAGHHWLPQTTMAEFFLKHNPLFVMPAYLMGLAMGTLFHRKQHIPHSAATMLVLAGTAGMCLMGSDVLHTDSYVEFTSLYLPAVAAIMFGLAHGGFPARLLRGRPLLVLGDSVYSLYLTQVPLGFTLMWIVSGFHQLNFLDIRNYPAVVVMPRFYFVALAVSLATSVLLFRYFETPWRIRLRRVLGRRWLDRPLPPPFIPGQSL